MHLGYLVELIYCVLLEMLQPIWNDYNKRTLIWTWKILILYKFAEFHFQSLVFCWLQTGRYIDDSSVNFIKLLWNASSHLPVSLLVWGLVDHGVSLIYLHSFNFPTQMEIYFLYAATFCNESCILFSQLLQISVLLAYTLHPLLPTNSEETSMIMSSCDMVCFKDVIYTSYFLEPWCTLQRKRACISSTITVIHA
jgi:hypothetical protein